MNRQVNKRSGNISITRLSEPAGAEVVGVDLSSELGVNERDLLFDALLKHHVRHRDYSVA